MSRSRQTAKKAGTAFETACAKYLSTALHKKITRMPKSGASDRGDLYGVECHGEPMAVECKSPGKESSWRVSEWWRETETEMLNYGARYGMLIIKRYRKPTSESVCVVDNGMWEAIGGTKYHQAEQFPAVAHGKWLEAIDKYTVCSVSRRGQNGSWVVMLLEVMADVIYRERFIDSVYITEEEIAEMLSSGELKVFSDSGQEITLIVGVPPEENLDDYIQVEPSDVEPPGFPEEAPLF